MQRLRYTGPLYARLDVPMPKRVQRFLDGPRPIVYVAITSSPPELVRTVVEALGTGARRLRRAGGRPTSYRDDPLPSRGDWERPGRPNRS